MIPMYRNRAVSSLFQAFGSEDRSPPADRRVATGETAMHRGETIAFAILFPLTVVVASFDVLVRLFGKFGGLLFTLPVAFLLLNVLPFIFGGRSSKTQWQLWSAGCFLWAIFHCQRSGFIGFMAYLWIAIGIMSGAAVGVMVWQRWMAISGKQGIWTRAVLLAAVHLLAVSTGFWYGWYFCLILGGAIAGFCCWMILNPSSQSLGPAYTTTDSAEILITIDDGPDPDDTPRLLDLLDHHAVKAIFFMIGDKVRKYPELAREVLRRGHEIGNHTQTHPQASFWCAGPARTRREIEECQKTIYEITGVIPVWFRAPVGHRNLFTHPVTRENGLRVMAWKRRGYDAVTRDPARVLARILPGMAGGDIVLLHEATPIAVDVLEGVLKARDAEPPSSGVWSLWG